MDRKHFMETVAQVAVMLGGYEVFDDFPDAAKPLVNLKKGREVIRISNPNWPAADRKKLSISGIYPYDDQHRYQISSGDNPPHIRVSADKGIGRIVRDIQKRFMPEYLRALELAEERIRAAKQYDDNRHAMLSRLGQIFNVEPARLNGTSGEWTLRTYNMSPYIRELRVGGTDVELHLWSLPVGLAGKILIIIKEAAKNENSGK